MARFYLDNDVALDLIPLLLMAGHTATSARDQGLSHAYDYVQMLAAWDHGAILVTHNRKHFVEQHEAWRVLPQRWGLVGPSHPGVIALDQCDEGTYAPNLLTFVATGHPIADHLHSWRIRGGWQQWRIGTGWHPVASPTIST